MEAAPDKIYSLAISPGIKRDGTVLDNDCYGDGQWVRFYLGRPKKIGGYRGIVNGFQGPIRLISLIPDNGNHIVNCFSGDGLECTVINDDGAGGGIYDRTPSGFTADSTYTWQSDLLFDSSGGGNNVLVAHGAKNLDAIENIEDTDVYYGTATDTAALTAIGQQVSGGCCVLQPYLFLYGNNGLIMNSAANQPTAFSSGDANEVNVSGTKVVKGLPVRGGGQSPAGLFWSLDSVIRVTYVGGTAKFKYDAIASQSSILSSNAVIEYDGIYYWPGIDRFLMYNGTIKEVPNQFNLDYFFTSLNWQYRQKVWVTKVPRWGEIWWVFPKDDSTEPNHAVIYNVRENCWYDTPLARTAGSFPNVFRHPIMADSETNDVVSSNTYRIWLHESGTDKVYDDSQEAIPSYFDTSDIGFAAGGPIGNQPIGDDVWTEVLRIEPDFVQSGAMTVQALGQQHAQSEETESATEPFSPTTGYVDLRTQQRLLRLRFMSNVQGGDYLMGRTQLTLKPGDKRQ